MDGRSIQTLMASPSTRLRDLLRVLEDVDDDGIVIREIWRRSANPPGYDVSIRMGLQKLWERGYVIRYPRQIRRGRELVKWHLTPEGREIARMIRDGTIKERLKAEPRAPSHNGEWQEI